jgi:hypothetical protein
MDSETTYPVGFPAIANWHRREFGLTLPDAPVALHDDIRVFDKSHLGTIEEPGPQSDYFADPSVEYLRGEIPDQYVASYWGHGINSYSQNFRYAYGDVAIFAQTHFGGYGDPDKMKRRWNTVVEVLSVYLRTVQNAPRGPEKARSRLLYYSSFRPLGSSDAPLWMANNGDEWTLEHQFTSWHDFAKDYFV